jgi:hypothetical protein
VIVAATDEGAGGIEVTLTGDRRQVEAMSLELQRLAKEYGVQVCDLRIRPADEPQVPVSTGPET